MHYIFVWEYIKIYIKLTLKLVKIKKTLIILKCTVQLWKKIVVFSDFLSIRNAHILSGKETFDDAMVEGTNLHSLTNVNAVFFGSHP